MTIEAKIDADMLPDGPRPLFPGQHLFMLFRDPIHLFMDAARYGKIVRLKIGSQPAFLINHPDYIQDVLVTHQRMFIKSLVLQRMRVLLGDGLLTSEGELHLRQRRLIQPAFHRQRISGYANIMTETAQKTILQWRGGQTRDIHAEMMRLTMIIAGQAMFGVNVEGEAAEIGQAITTLLHGSQRLRLPFWKQMMDLPLPVNRRLEEARQRLDRFIYTMIAERRSALENGGTDKYNDLMAMLLQAKDEGEDGSGMSEGLIRDEVLTLFLAGHETTANALTWTWYLLSQNPQVEAKLYAEIKQVLEDRIPTADDVERLPYTRMVLSESLRLYPPSWTISRQNLEDYPMGNFILPAGSTLLMSQWVMHHDPDYYPDPWRFDPERWTIEAVSQRPRFAYFPFGGGPRVCIGEPFAWMEGILILATIAQRWQMRLEAGQKIGLLPQVTLRPKYGMRMVLKERIE